MVRCIVTAGGSRQQHADFLRVPAVGEFVRLQLRDGGNGKFKVTAVTHIADIPERPEVELALVPCDKPAGFETSGAGLALPDEVKTIELWACRYDAPCKVHDCSASATMIARSTDSDGRPINQYELCQPHADQVAQRELAKGRQIVHREVG